MSKYNIEALRVKIGPMKYDDDEMTCPTCHVEYANCTFPNST